MRILQITAVCILFFAAPAVAQLGEWVERLGFDEAISVENGETAAGLREALYIGSENAVLKTGQVDGYFRNEVIKILLPENLERVEQGMRMMGQGERVDEFVLSMNRAAEKAAPYAREIFWGAIKRIDFHDAHAILTGGDTAATDYFRAETSAELTEAFRPVVERATDEFGVTRKYKELVGGYFSIPFVQSLAFDVDDYVVEKALDGLFYVLAEEERQIRTNPAARVTELLQRVFSQS